jgi:hypothetical protein
MTNQDKPCYLCLFGELTLYHPNSAGELQPHEIQGVTCHALLAAMAVARQAQTRDQLFQQVWGLPTENIKRIHNTTGLLKKRLKPNEGILAKPPGRLGLSTDATVLQTDWALFQDLVKAERYAEVLALARRGTPLESIKNGDELVGRFVRRLRKDALTAVIRACSDLNLATDFQWGDPIPDDWPTELPVRWPSFGVHALARHVEPTRTAEMLPVRGLGTRPDGDWSSDDLFESCPTGRDHLEKELAGARPGSATWWPEGTNKWFGEYYAFWHRTVTVPCEQVKIEYIPERYDSSYYDVSSEHDGDNDKAILVGTKLLSDSPRLICARSTWNFTHEWAKEHAEELLKMPSLPSVFGLVGRKPYPGIAGVHTLLQTSDGFLLFALRAMQVDFHEGTWSASFEESLAANGRDFTGHVTGDRTVMDAIDGGLFEEWGIDSSTVTIASFLAVGREYVRTNDGGLGLSSSVLAAARLNITLREVWKCLADAPGIRDRDEHSAWAGIHFASRSQLLGFLAAARGRRDNVDLLVHLAGVADAELEFYPGAASSEIPDFGLMPTSAARLYLGTQWLVRYGWMES